jgi:serine/threonine protein kinase
MLDENYNIRVIDFGLGKGFESDNSLLYTRCGSFASSAPEIILNQPYNHKCDIWSLGIIFYEMLFGKLPFYSTNQQALFKQILNNEPDYQLISKNLVNLLQQLLAKNPIDRISLSNCQKYSSLLFSTYQQQLNLALTNVKTFYQDLFITNNEDDKLDGKDQQIRNHILTREKITHFLQCLETLTLDGLCSSQQSEQNEISQSRSGPTTFQFKNKSSLLGSIKIPRKQSTSHILPNRRKTIQHSINLVYHIPILNSAKSGNIVK